MGKNKKVIIVMKDELGGQIMKKFISLRPRTYAYLKDNDGENKKARSTKRCAVKRKLKFQVCKKCLKASQIENIINYLEKKWTDADNLKWKYRNISVEIYPCGMSKDTICKKEKIKRNSIIKQYKKWLILMML